MTETTYHGGCHCGAVRFSAKLDFNQPTIRCNCSICGKSRAWWAFAPAAKFTLDEGGNALIHYRFTPPGREQPTTTYYVCRTCGIRTHAQGEGPEGSTVAVAVATIEDVGDDAEKLASSVTYVDGLHDQFDQEPEDVRIL